MVAAAGKRLKSAASHKGAHAKPHKAVTPQAHPSTHHEAPQRHAMAGAAAAASAPTEPRPTQDVLKFDTPPQPLPPHKDKWLQQKVPAGALQSKLHDDGSPLDQKLKADETRHL
jgi:hypothetical protein